MASWVKATEECVRMLYCPGSELPNDVILHLPVYVWFCGCFGLTRGSRIHRLAPPHPKAATGFTAAAVEPSEAEQAECSGRGAVVSGGGAAGISCDQSNFFQKADSMYWGLNHGCGWKKNTPVLWHLVPLLHTQPWEMCHTIKNVRSQWTANLGFGHKVFRLYSFVT